MLCKTFTVYRWLTQVHNCRRDLIHLKQKIQPSVDSDMHHIPVYLMWPTRPVVCRVCVCLCIYMCVRARSHECMCVWAHTCTWMTVCFTDCMDLCMCMYYRLSLVHDLYRSTWQSIMPDYQANCLATFKFQFHDPVRIGHQMSTPFTDVTQLSLNLDL